MEFVAKQMLSSKLGGVKGGLDKLTSDKEPTEEEIKRAEEIEEARKEAEERRKEKHRKMEAEREDMRQGIRDKYNLKKKEVSIDETLTTDTMSTAGGLGRKKKTQEELARENQLALDDDKPIIDQIGDQINHLTDRTTKLINEQCTIS